MNIATEIAVISMILSMLMVFLFSWRWTGSLRSAFIIMLIIGKIWCGILAAFHIDKPLFNLVIYNKVKGTVTTITFTANMVVFLSFFFTLLFTLVWPYIASYLPKQVRQIQLIESVKSEKGVR